MTYKRNAQRLTPRVHVHTNLDTDATTDAFLLRGMRSYAKLTTCFGTSNQLPGTLPTCVMCIRTREARQATSYAAKTGHFFSQQFSGFLEAKDRKRLHVRLSLVEHHPASHESNESPSISRGQGGKWSLIRPQRWVKVT